MSLTNSDSQDFLNILRSERRDLLDRLRKTQFSTLKHGYSHFQIIPHSSYSPWFDDDRFKTIYDSVKNHTMVDIYRCYELYLLTKQIEFIPGDIVEIGVWRGGTAALIAASLSRQKNIYLFDTFNGVAKADKNHDTLYLGGEHADSAETDVITLFDKMNLVCKVFPGIFPDDTLYSLPEYVSLAHIDVDTYASARDSFYAIWPKIQPYGLVVFDDYGFFGCEGVALAVNEIKATVDNACFIYNINGHGILIKKY